MEKIMLLHRFRQWWSSITQNNKARLLSKWRKNEMNETKQYLVVYENYVDDTDARYQAQRWRIA